MKQFSINFAACYVTGLFMLTAGEPAQPLLDLAVPCLYISVAATFLHWRLSGGW